MDSIAEALELAAAEGTRQQVGPCMLTLQMRCAVLPGASSICPMMALEGWPIKGMHVGLRLCGVRREVPLFDS